MIDPWLEDRRNYALIEHHYRLIEQHPLFNRLIREVAAAECCVPPRNLGWLRRNSRTYGSWMTRTSTGLGGQVSIDAITRNSRRRANVLCAKIAAELFPKGYADLPREQEAKVWVTARDYARAREFYHA